MTAPTGFDVEVIGRGVLRVRKGATSVTATRGTRGAPPQVTVVHGGQTLCSDRLDLAEAASRQSLIRKLRKQSLIIEPGMLVALASALQSGVHTGGDSQDAHAPYRQTDEGYFLVRPSGQVRLSNFRAVITAQRLEDDGLETRRVYRIEVRLGSRIECIEVPASAFHTMDWVASQLGADAIIAAGGGVRDHLRAAIQIHSGLVPQEIAVLAHGLADVRGVPRVPACSRSHRQECRASWERRRVA